MSKRFRFLVRIPLLIVLILAISLAWHHQAVQDWIKLYNYQPPPNVTHLATDIALTGEGRHLLYVNHPAIEDRAAFNASCSSHGEQTIVLGCYHSVDQGIFIFNITNSQLNGIDQVTTAHEMLHAAYDRLSSSTRAVIDSALENYYRSDLKDERIRAVIASYKQTEPNDVINEMHSVFGTEVANLPPNLESYYKQYFTDRAKVVTYANAYQAEFTSRQNQVTADDQQLTTMKQQIADTTVALDNQQANISTSRTKLDGEKNSGNIAAYNADVPGYNAKITSYNNLIVSTKALIADYNQLVATRNQLALQITDLAHSIDSTFTSISQ